MTTHAQRSFQDIRNALLQKQEVALVDVREEAPYAEAHPLFAINLPLSKIELEAYARIPRHDTVITVYDNGEGHAEPAAARFIELGYSNVALLTGGLQGWKDAGGELFIDVNVPSKSFGELVESKAHTPSLSAEEVKQLIDDKADVVILDSRRFDEYNTMSIPGGVSVPGGELVLRVRELAPNPNTRVIVNCAGRTRSIIGTQSLVNAGIPNQVAALRNGTMGWLLAGQQLDHGAQRRFPDFNETTRQQAAADARSVADRTGVLRITRDTLKQWQADAARTTYLFDVRTPEEYEVGHLPGTRSTPGGQLVQETDHFASVRGARIVLVDDDGTRANMAASWLAQMNWEVAVLDDTTPADFTERGNWHAPLPALPQISEITVETLTGWLAEDGTQTVLLDLGTSAGYVKQHIPGAYWAVRSLLADAVKALPAADRIVVIPHPSEPVHFAARDVASLSGKPVFVLQGGTRTWAAAGHPTETGETHLASPRIDRYRRPYEGTNSPREAMQAYLDWEFGLIEQLGRDGTHGFKVLEPN